MSLHRLFTPMHCKDFLDLVSLFAVSSKSPHRRILIHSNDMTDPLNVNTLHNVNVVQEFIRIAVGSEVETLTEDLR